MQYMKLIILDAYRFTTIICITRKPTIACFTDNDYLAFSHEQIISPILCSMMLHPTIHDTVTQSISCYNEMPRK